MADKDLKNKHIAWIMFWTFLGGVAVIVGVFIAGKASGDGNLWWLVGLCGLIFIVAVFGALAQFRELRPLRNRARISWIRRVLNSGPFYVHYKIGLKKNEPTYPTSIITLPEGSSFAVAMGTAGEKFEVEVTPWVGGSLTILEATYGAEGHLVNVTDKLTARVQSGRLIALVDNVEFSDPAVGVTKVLQVRYRYRGRERVREFIEGNFIKLPDDDD